MKLSTFRTLLIVLLFPAMAHAAREIWLAPRTDGAAGRGTQADPYDASTQQKFDALLLSDYKSRETGIVFHLAPGTYYTRGEAAGWRCLSNWKFHGAGMDVTVVKLAGWIYGDKLTHGGNTAFSAEQPYKTGIAITDLTVDCSWLDFGSRLSGTFTQPSADKTVTVPVLTSKWATVGKEAYLQRLDDYSEVGIYEVTAVPDGTHVTLKSAAGKGDNLPAGAKVSGPVFVGPAVNTCGIGIGSKNCDVERVHVTNTGTPIYEATCGIIIVHLGSKHGEFALADGNVIRQCLVDHVWGTHGTCISIISNNPDVQDGTYISGILEDNVINSNGWHQGFGSYGTANSIWANNIVSNCRMGWFVDVGYNKDDQIVNNSFIENVSGIQLGGGYVNGWARFNISGNHLFLRKESTGILFNGEVHDTMFSNNQIIAPEGAHGGGITVNAKATEGLIISNNLESGGLSNLIPAGTGACFNNVTEKGVPITIRQQ